VAVSPDARRIATGGKDHRVCIWALDVFGAFQLQHTLTGHAIPITRVVWMDDCQLLTGGLGHDVCVWDTVTGRESTKIRVVTAGVQALVACPSVMSIFIATVEYTIVLVDLDGAVLHTWAHALLRDAAFSHSTGGTPTVWSPSPSPQCSPHHTLSVFSFFAVYRVQRSWPRRPIASCNSIQ
jgi:WD40 repeat protein